MSAGSAQQRLVDGMRGVRYGEVLGVFARDEELVAEVYGTQLLNDCPQQLWESLDPTAIAADLGALFVKLNGPRHWVLDGLGTKVATLEPVVKDFGGIAMRRIAEVKLGDNPVPTPYIERKIDRGSVFFFDAGKPVWELVSPEGAAYVMQAYCIGVDPTIGIEMLPELGGRLSLPTGWSYRQRILDEDLVIDTTSSLATVIQDELENSYTLPY